MKFILTVIVFFFLPVTSFGAGGVSGKLSSITVKETGYILIKLEAPHSNPMGCEQDQWVAIAEGHAAKKEIMSVVLSAKILGKAVSFWINDCYANYGTTYPVGVTASIY